jgi:hypothetical protein
VTSIEAAAAPARPRAAGRRGKARARWAWAAGAAAAATLLMLCYLRIAGATQVNSDGAGLELEAWSILHGNVLLHGWWASDVSFYTTETPEYVLVTWLAGLRPEVVHICSALTYTLLVLLAAFVARGRARGAAGVARALLAAGVILAPQPTGPTQVLLGSPDHVGSVIPVLVLLLLLDWARPRWWVPVLAGVLLAWSIVGDPLIEVVGAAPLFLVCLIRAIRLVRPGPSAADGGHRAPWWQPRTWSAARYELALAAAAVVAVPAAKAANRLLIALGGIRTAGASYHLLPQQNETLHAGWLAVRCLLALFGADFVPGDFVGGTSAAGVAFAVMHLLGVAVVLTAVLLAAYRLVRPRARLTTGGQAAAGQEPDLVADFLVLGMVVNFAAFIIEVPIENIYSAHEIGPLLGMGAALAGRMLGGPLIAAWRAGLRSWRRVLLTSLTAWMASYVVLLGIAAAHQQAAPRNVKLTDWLARHHLRDGLAPYWEAASVTVDSGGADQVLALAKAGGRVVPGKWQSNVLLAQTKTSDARFVILSSKEDIGKSSVIRTFGKPAATYRYAQFTILVWHKNLLPELAGPAPAKSRHHAARTA